MLRHVIVGTAGHIDHGKTSLVKALTGKDADRLAEEKRRGITIDLGFADTEIAGTRFAFIDVPGHEKFVRNMLAGVGGINLVLLVVAADEGVMPQTREHFQICTLLGIERGVIALTKADAASAEQITAAQAQVRELVGGSFLASAPVVRVSALSGGGLDTLRAELAKAAAAIAEHDEKGVTRLPIDRVFTMKGFGTVITGTLIAGVIQKDDELEVHPARQRVRVRSIQVHGAEAAEARAGQRTAINLAGVDKADLARGMMLAAPGMLRSTQIIDAELSMLSDTAPLRTGTRFHLHAYSAETVATVKEIRRDGSKTIARFKLDDPLQLVVGDRFILRRFSPVTTVGGGWVLHPAPGTKPKLRDRQHVFIRSFPEWIEQAGAGGITIAELVALTGRPSDEVLPSLQADHIAGLGDAYFPKSAVVGLHKQAQDAVRAFQSQNKLAPGMNGDELRGKLGLSASAFQALLAQLEGNQVLQRNGNVIRIYGEGARLEAPQSQAMQQIADTFLQAGLKVPFLSEALATVKVPRAEAVKIVTLLLRERTLIKLGDDLVFHRDALAKLKPMLADYTARTRSNAIDVAGFKELTGISRKYAIPLLEHLDRERVTRRDGNRRIIL